MGGAEICRGQLHADSRSVSFTFSLFSILQKLLAHPHFFCFSISHSKVKVCTIPALSPSAWETQIYERLICELIFFGLNKGLKNTANLKRRRGAVKERKREGKYLRENEEGHNAESQGYHIFHFL